MYSFSRADERPRAPSAPHQPHEQRTNGSPARASRLDGPDLQPSATRECPSPRSPQWLLSVRHRNGRAHGAQASRHEETPFARAANGGVSRWARPSIAPHAAPASHSGLKRSPHVNMFPHRPRNPRADARTERVHRVTPSLLACGKLGASGRAHPRPPTSRGDDVHRLPQRCGAGFRFLLP